MATTEYTLTISDDYVAPKGPLTKAEYVDFVMNMAAKSYQTQHGVEGAEAGIEAALDAYNASLPQDVEPEE